MSFSSCRFEFKSVLSLAAFPCVCPPPPLDLYISSCAISCYIAQRTGLCCSTGNEMISLSVGDILVCGIYFPPQCHFVKHFEMRRNERNASRRSSDI